MDEPANYTGAARRASPGIHKAFNLLTVRACAQGRSSDRYRLFRLAAMLTSIPTRLRKTNMNTLLKKTVAAALMMGGLFAVQASQAAQPQDLKGKNVVLVHGAFADGSSWDKVIPLLEARGLHVTSVQNPLTSLGDDVSATTRAIDRQNGPVVLVGH